MRAAPTHESAGSGTDVVGASIGSSEAEVTHTNIIADFEELVTEIGWRRRRAGLLAEDFTHVQAEYQRLQGEGLKHLLRLRTAEQAKRDVPSLLRELADSGFAWSDIARIVGVSVPALRKWRQGDSPSGENRRRIAELVAVCLLIPERSPIIQDVAGWLETPLSPDSPICGIDLLIRHRYDLLFEYTDGADPEEILDAFNPSWRDDGASDVEVFTAADGMPALRLRSGVNG